MKEVIRSHQFKTYLNRVTTAAVIISAVTCLIPDVAEALPKLTFSGTSKNGVGIDFDIDLLATDEDNDSNTGRFSGAIQNFSYQSFRPPFQPQAPRARFEFGDLTTSLGGPGGTVKYEITFNPDTTKVIRNDFGDPNIDPPDLFARPEDFKLTLLISSTDLNLVNSLSGQLPTPIVIEYAGPDFGTFTLVDSSRCEDKGDKTDCSFKEVDVPATTESVPEPATVLGLLGFGALGTASLRKRNKR